MGMVEWIAKILAISPGVQRFGCQPQICHLIDTFMLAGGMSNLDLSHFIYDNLNTYNTLNINMLILIYNEYKMLNKTCHPVHVKK